MKRIVKWVLWLLFALAVVFTFYYLWSNSQPKEQEYEVVEVQSGDSISHNLLLAGTIKPRDEVAIKPQIPGIISDILVKPGQEVKVGDVIAKIVVVPDLQQVNNAESQLEQSRLNLEHIRGIHKRDQELYNKGLMATEEYEKSRTELTRAEQQYHSALNAFEITKSGVSQRYSKQSSTLVRATRSGKVLSIPVKVGSSVVQANNFNEGTTIATIADMTNLIFEGKADETEVGKLLVGQAMTLTIGALPDIKLSAEVEYISPLGENVSGATRFEVRGALQGLTSEIIARLRSGFSVNAKIIIAEARGILTLPEACIVYRNDSTYVNQVVTETPWQTKEVAISIGLSDGNKVEVKKGLKAGDKVQGNEIMDF